MRDDCASKEHQPNSKKRCRRRRGGRWCGAPSSGVRLPCNTTLKTGLPANDGCLPSPRTCNPGQQATLSNCPRSGRALRVSTSQFGRHRVWQVATVGGVGQGLSTRPCHFPDPPSSCVASPIPRSLSDLSLVEARRRPRVGFRGGGEADSAAARHLIDLRSSFGSLQGYVLTVVMALGLPFTPPAVRAAA